MLHETRLARWHRERDHCACLGAARHNQIELPLGALALRHRRADARPRLSRADRAAQELLDGHVDGRGQHAPLRVQSQGRARDRRRGHGRMGERGDG